MHQKPPRAPWETQAYWKVAGGNKEYDRPSFRFGLPWRGNWAPHSLRCSCFRPGQGEAPIGTMSNGDQVTIMTFSDFKNAAPGEAVGAGSGAESRCLAAGRGSLVSRKVRTAGHGAEGSLTVAEAARLQCPSHVRKARGRSRHAQHLNCCNGFLPF